MNSKATKFKPRSVKHRELWGINPVQKPHSTPSGKKRPSRQSLKQRLKKGRW